MSEQRDSNPLSTEGPAMDAYARISDAVLALDDEWRFTHLNERAERILERPEAELLGELAWDVLPTEGESTFRRECERAMETQDSVTFEEFYPPRSTWFEVRAYPSETGVTVRLADATEQVHWQETLRERERALRRAYEVITDDHQSFRQQIDALLTVVREALGADYATISRVREDANEYVFELVDAPEDADLEPGDSVLLDATNCEQVVETEQTLVLNDVEAEAPELADRAGNAEWGISCYLGTPVTVGGEVYGTFCFYDMEARSEEFTDWETTFVDLLGKWVGSELERKRQHARLESFASMLAHELRNPLSIAQLYNKQAADGDRVATEEVAAALDRIEEMIDILLVIARGEDSTIETEPVALTTAATETWATVSADDAELAVETDRTVEADPIHIQHLLENLFTNAVEHSGPDATVRVGDTPGGFFVEDDGTGIPAAERNRIFDAGYTTDENGIGLGLTFVTQLADSYGWNCTASESDAGGARFEFTNVALAD
jgi:signal transduction histidine kinase